MLRIVTPAQMQQLEALLIQQGFTPEMLMEAAAEGAFQEARRSALETQYLIFAGPGNNGGDALALARKLWEVGFTSVWVCLVGSEAKRSELMRLQLERLKIPKSQFFQMNVLPPLAKDLVVIDGILGLGSRLPLSGEFADAARILSDLPAYSVIALDIPTGLDAETGEVDPALRKTLFASVIAIGAPKMGCFVGEGAKYANRVDVAGLNAPIDFDFLAIMPSWLIEQGDFVPNFPGRKEGGSKFDYGRLFILAGSRGMTGAAILASHAALRAGAGMVTTAVPTNERFLVAQAIPELMTLACAETESGQPSIKGWKNIEAKVESSDVLLIGPGLIPEEETTELILKLLEIPKPMVLDAGALGALVGRLELLKERKAPTILTPNSGEFAKLLGVPREELEAGRRDFGREFAQRHNVTLVAKGATTYTCAPDGAVYINSTGNAGLSKAGSGDVLAGVIAGILAQKIEFVKASWLGVYLHGQAADLSLIRLAETSLMATDVINYLPNAMDFLGIE